MKNFKISIVMVSILLMPLHLFAEIFIDKNIDRSVYASKCVKNNYYKGLELALKEHADPNFIDSNGQSLLVIASALKNDKIVKLLLSYKANPNLYDKDHNNALLLASAHNNIKVLDTLFKYSQFTIDLKVVNKDDSSPLMIAVNTGKYDVVKFLIEKGSDVNFINNVKLTPLLISVMFGKDDEDAQKIVNLLVSKKANIDVKSNSNINILDYAKKRKLHNIYQLLITNN